MKTCKSSITLLLMISLNFHLMANDGKFTEAMTKNIALIYAAKEIPQFQEAVNSFQRIASVEKDRWEPLYYIAFGNIMMANFEKDGSRKDIYLDQAMNAINVAKTLAPKESEILALEGFTYMLRIGVDPQSRGMVYAPQANQAYKKALELNPSNPRALALSAQMQFGSAQFFGSPTTDACKANVKAIESFENDKNKNPLAPVWGLKMAESLADRCK